MFYIFFLFFFLRESEGLTGRSLRKVPLRVLSTQLVPEKVVRLEEFIAAMLTVVRQMKSEQLEINKNNNE